MNALSRAPKLLRLPRPVNYRLLPTATTGVTNVKVIRPPDRGICTSVRMCSKPGHDEFTDMLKDEKERKEKESREEEEDLMVKDRVLGASLQFVPAYGWSKHSVQAGAESLGYPAVTSGIIADPAIDLILHHYESSNLKLEKIIKEELAIHGGDKRKSGSEVDELLKKYIEMRLRMNIPYMSRWSEAMAVMSYPQYAPSSLNMGLKLVDSIWHSVGDDSVDFSWYTKRLSLYAIYKSTEVAMIQDTSDDYQDTWAFLSRRFTDCQGLRDFFGTPEDVLKTLSSAAVTLKSTLGGNR